jgi:hypothetical protein
MTDEKRFDGRVNFAADDAVEVRLEEHFRKFSITSTEIWKHFPVYVRRLHLKRFLAHYELFRLIVDLPGDILELGVFRGTSLMSWANFLEIRCMGDRQRRVFGFDNFMGFTGIDEKDGAIAVETDKVVGGFDSSFFEEMLRDAIEIYDSDRFIPYKSRVVLVKGDVEKTIPEFVEKNPGVRISLLHFDVDLYQPTLVALRALWPLVVPGGIVAFDEYGIPPWEGESRAVDEFFSSTNVELRRFHWSSNPGAYLIKR